MMGRKQRKAVPGYGQVMQASFARLVTLGERYRALSATLDIDSPTWVRDMRRLAEQYDAQTQVLTSLTPPPVLMAAHIDWTRAVRRVTDAVYGIVTEIQKPSPDIDAVADAVMQLTIAYQNGKRASDELRQAVQDAAATEKTLQKLDTTKLQA